MLKYDGKVTREDFVDLDSVLISLCNYIDSCSQAGIYVPFPDFVVSESSRLRVLCKDIAMHAEFYQEESKD